MSTAFAEKCRKVICIGRNYADHITELNNSRPTQPFFFLKPPSSMLLPGRGPILAPRGVNCHYEVELALVMGRTVKDFSVVGRDRATVESEVIDSIAGMQSLLVLIKTMINIFLNRSCIWFCTVKRISSNSRFRLRFGD